jgi:uncharacterized protein YdeI (YjbR/CyaY-like superfamily)
LLVGFYNKESGKGGLTYPQALDEALCFGWIDGVRRNVDASSYSIRFTPRKPSSNWSEVNTKRMHELIADERVHASGLSAFEKRDPEKTKQYSYEERHRDLAEPFAQRLREDEKAWAYLESQPPGYRRLAGWFVMSAKKDETRWKRLAQLIECCQEGKRLDQTLPGKRK